jgi:adenylate cyclase
LLLSLLLPTLPAAKALALSVLLLGSVTGLNGWLYLGHGLVLPLASAWVLIVSAFALNMAYGYFAESRSKRELAHLFGTYVPPELVDEMVKNPDAYTMQASARELTVMFCDMRGFTRLSETLTPEQLQDMLNRVFSRLTMVIRDHRGTIDKYMGDCIMAFWGAPVPAPDHAALAVRAALAMTAELDRINSEHRTRGLPQIGIGIGLNTGSMLVGDMGSDIRRSYTVIGDAVNVAARLEGLARVYGVDVVVGENTRRQVRALDWQELDRVVVKGREEALTIYTPRQAKNGAREGDLSQELTVWAQFLRSYRAQDWGACDLHLLNLERLRPSDPLYAHYAQQLRSRCSRPADPNWDGITRFTSK